MRKIILLLMLSLLMIGMAWGQGLEDFTNSNAGTGYTTSSFVGNNSVTWSYVASRDENADDNGSGIVGKALMLRRSSDNSAVSSSTISGGIGDFSVKLYKGFTGGGNRQVELFVNGVSKGTSTVFDDYLEHVFTVTGVNVAGNITIQIKNTTSKQVIVDDITWTAYAGGSTPTITVNPATLTGFTYVFGSGSSTEQSFTVSGTNMTAGISVAAATNYEISKTSGSGFTTPLTYTLIEAATDQTVYVRLKAGLAIGTYNSEVLTASSTGASDKTVTCSGEVTTPPAPDAPTATAATDVATTSFKATWGAASGATGYYLDVYTKTTGGNASDLFISEYIEGSSYNKGIEIYNGTGTTIDLSTYSLKQYNNGATTPTYTTTPLSGNLTTGSVYRIVLNTQTIFGTNYDLSTAESAMGFNGNDAMAIFNGTTLVDIVGAPGDASNWGKDVTLVRKAAATVPSATYLSTDWDSYGTDILTYWGSHTFSGGSSNSFVSGYQNLNVSNVTNYSVTVPTQGTTYYYVVRAYNAYGTSANSNEIDVTTLSSSTPTITLSSAALTAFSATVGTPSAAQTYTAAGVYLTANIGIAAVTGFEYSTDDTDYYSTLSLTPSSGTVATTTIYVRLTGAAAGTPSGDIAHTSTGATQQDKAVSGTVTSATPTITLSEAALVPFSATVGTPSAAQTYTVAGVFLTADISIAAVTGFEYSTDDIDYYSTLTLTQTGGTVAETTVYVRLTGAEVATPSGDIAHTSTGATQQDKAVSGAVTAPVSATTFLEENFVYTEGTTLVSNGWVAHSGAGTLSPTVANQNLTYTSYLANAGLSGQMLGNGEDVHRNFAPQAEGVVYSSFLINVTSATTADAYLYHFATEAELGTDFKGRLFVGKDASENLRFGLSKASGTATSFTPYEYALNTTYLVVLKYEFVDGATNDLVSAWINPVIGSTVPTAILTGAASDADIGTSGVGSVAIRQSNAAVTAVFDGIRVTNDWEQLWVAPAVQTIYASVTELDPLACIVDLPSEEIRSYTLYGTNLQGQIVVTAPTGFQVSVSETEGWDTSLSLAPAFNDTIYVRMLADTEDNYSDVITHTSGTATQVDVAVSGECYPPAVTWNITQSLVPFSATAGTPSANQSYTLGTTTATGDITVATTAPFELSTTGSSGWLTELTLPYTFNATVYVRMNASAASTYNAEITHNTADASPNAFSISGTATAPAGSYAADLFFSEYVEGSGNRKAIEIFNGTGSSVDLADYSIMKQVNGAGAFGNEKVLVGTLAHGDVYVIVYSNASNSLKDELYVDLASSEGFMSFNGNDAIALYHSSVQTDVIGIVDQVTPDWGKDVTLVRKPTIITPTTSFSFDDWNSFAIDTFTDLGMHTFTPGGATEYVANPTFDPPAGYKTSAFDVTIATETVGATIRYTLDGNAPDVSSAVFTPPLNISSTTTLKAIAYKDGYTPSSIMTAIYTFPVDVSNIAALRASAQGATVYRLTGEAVLTFQQAGRNQKYIQDATGAIVIDDLSGIITSTYALYDGITGIAGTIALYNGLLQFTPVANPGTATSSNNVVTPAVRTLATITTDDQAKLLKIMNVTLTPSVLGTFLATAENIVAADASGAGTLRTFPDADYATTTIPATPVNITCLGGQFGDAMQFSPRFLTDIEAAGGTLDTPVVVITQDGTDVVLTWGEITGATGGYRIESSDEPYTGFTTVTTTSLLTWSGTAVSKKFFRVIALP